MPRNPQTSLLPLYLKTTNRLKARPIKTGTRMLYLKKTPMTSLMTTITLRQVILYSRLKNMCLQRARMDKICKI